MFTPGSHPPGEWAQRENVDPELNSLSLSLLSSLVTTKFFVNNEFSPDSLPNVSCFDLFVKNPKGCKLEVIQGSHKFLSDVIKGSEQSPKNSVFIGLFNHFTEKKIKDYVFQRMTKSILQELALCILQELISYGPGRAGNLNLVLGETKTGGRTVVIQQPSEEFPVDEEFVREIDEAFFTLHDLTGFSPERKVAAGQGHEAPCSPPDERGYFTPKKTAPKSLERAFEVSAET